MESKQDYIVIGGGLAGVSAIEGIRERDKRGSILLLANEAHAPYDRPPLTKQLWFGKKRLEDVFLHDERWYTEQDAQLRIGRTAMRLDCANKAVIDDLGGSHFFRKLIFVTGGAPRRLPIPGGELEGVCYYRNLDDYTKIRALAKKGVSAVVIGGGFIGSEIAAALSHAEVAVTMVFPDPYLCSRVFPEDLGRFLQQQYRERGIRILDHDLPVAISGKNGLLTTNTRSGERLESDVIIVGIGIHPSIDLAKDARLSVGDGVIVNNRLQSSCPDIYAAGDNALFPYAALGHHVRVEHWDNALTQGKHAGRNAAGDNEPYLHMPYFFSDLFEFGYEAVGEVDARLDVFSDWIEPNRKGVVYYLSGGAVRGAMMCDVWGKVDDARQLIRKGAKASPSELKGAIR